MPFSKIDYDQIFQPESNTLLRCTPDQKYEKYKETDPFPEIGDALLNSVDIVKYCVTTAMINPFDITCVKGVTYTCHFSGTYYYWSGNEANPIKITQKDNPELTLRPNSITYLEISEMFRVPDYLIIRYNLQVNHVYKGLLLGTGPIVDPGFVGRLYIPLHNLTSNEYRIKRNAPLITLEFTKVGRNKAASDGICAEDEAIWPKHEKCAFDFSGIHHQVERIEAGRDFDRYLHKALIGNELFRKTTDNLCVGSSIPERIESAEKAALSAKESAKKSENSLTFARNILFGIGIVGFLSIMATLIGIFVAMDARIDNVLSSNISIAAENNRLQEENALLLEENAVLQTMIDELTSDVGTQAGPFE